MYHPVFGIISEQDPFRDLITADHVARQKAEIALIARYLAAVIDGTEDPANIELPGQRRCAYRPDLIDKPAHPFAPMSRTDADGVVWDLQPPGTTPNSGDLDDDEGLWRPRMTASMCETRYDRAVLKRIEAQRRHAEMAAAYGEADPRTIAAKFELRKAEEAQSKALKDADTPDVRAWERHGQWRANEGREEYNASRRTRTEANVDRNASQDEKDATAKRKAAARAKAYRDKKKAAKAKV